MRITNNEDIVEVPLWGQILMGLIDGFRVRLESVRGDPKVSHNCGCGLGGAIQLGSEVAAIGHWSLGRTFLPSFFPW